MTILNCCVQGNQRSVCGKGVLLRVLCFSMHSVCHFLFSCSATRLLHLAQAQNIHATVEPAARRSGVFNANFLLNRSDNKVGFSMGIVWGP